MKLIQLFILVSLGFSCTNSKPTNEAAGSSDSLEFAVDSLEPQKAPEEVAIKSEEQPVEIKKDPEDQIAEVKQEEMKIEMPEEPRFEQFKKTELPVAEKEDPKIIVTEKPIESSTVYQKEEQEYVVQKSDTLMLIGFKIYGDYRKWKDLKAWNEEKTKLKLAAGMKLKYHLPEKEFGWNPSGLPYLVKTGDTLGLISMDKYGTSKKWKNIFENNRPLIRDPNLIFAGFTIYYIPTRDVASESR